MTENRAFSSPQCGAHYGAHLKNVGHIRVFWGTLPFGVLAHSNDLSAPKNRSAPRSAPPQTRRKLRISTSMGHRGHFYIKIDRKVK